MRALVPVERVAGASLSAVVLDLEAVTEALRREVAGGIARQAERFGNRRAEERVAERVEHQRQRAFGNVMRVVTSGELRNQSSDRIEDWIERVAVAGEDHPRGECSRTLFSECIETLVDDHPRVALARAGALDGFGDAAVHRVRDRFGKLPLQPGGRTEVVEQIGVRPADLSRDRLQGHGLRPLRDQQLARRGQRGRATFFRGQAGSSY